jgi:PEP-CTERM motif
MKYLWLGIYIAFSFLISSSTYASVLEIKHAINLNEKNEPFITQNNSLPYSASHWADENTNKPEWQQLRIADAARHSTTPSQQSAIMTAARGTVPEPETYLLIGLGIVALISRGLHRNK